MTQIGIIEEYLQVPRNFVKVIAAHVRSTTGDYMS